MHWLPRLVGRERAENSNMQDFFQTTLYNPYLASMSPYLAVAKVHIQPFHCSLLIVVDGRGPSIYF